MRRRRTNIVPPGMILLILTIVCVVLLFISYTTSFFGGSISTATGYLFMPLEKSVSWAGELISDNRVNAATKEELQAENESLQQEVSDLKSQLTEVQLEQNRLDELEELFDLSQTLSDYETTGADIVAKGTNNWFNSFTINKGSADGIEVGMNVLSQKGLVGIVTSVSEHYAIVRSIIDDNSNVSGMISTTSDNCIISGSIEMMNESNTISLTNLRDTDNQVSVGDPVVTSNVSDKYFPGILIGYIASVDDESSSLTKTGTVSPAVDFMHLTEVLVILQLKETSDNGD